MVRSRCISEEQALLLRKTCSNPARVFAPAGHTHAELQHKSYQEIVDLFKKRVITWYFDFGDSTSKNYKTTILSRLAERMGITHKVRTGDINFVMTVLCCVIIDMLSQYIYGKPASSESLFIKFFTEHLAEYNRPIKPVIVSCHFRKGKWQEIEIDNVADGFYHCFRCGVVHSARILDYGRINEECRDVIDIWTWGEKNDKNEIVVHPKKLLSKLRSIFLSYIENLKKEDVTLKANFVRKINFDYGFVIRDCKT